MKSFVFCSVLLISSVTALADECGVLDIDQAKEAQSIISGAGAIYLYCEACTDAPPRLIIVNSVEILEHSAGYSIYINQTRRDLAHVFDANSPFRNIGSAVRCPNSSREFLFKLANKSRPKTKSPEEACAKFAVKQN